jgi:hypothetical protein
MTLRLNGSTSGYTEIDAPAIAGSNTFLLPAGPPATNGSVLTCSTAGAMSFSSDPTLTSLNGGALAGTRNRIINGDMRIDQRNAGASVTIGATTVTYTVDRWAAYSAAASKFSVQRSTTAPGTFSNSALVTSLAATTPGASDGYVLFQKVEGFNWADLAYGTASAKSCTISFWVRSSLTGTFGGVLKNGSEDRNYPFSYSISAANTWEYKTITVTGDTSGTWASDSSAGALLVFDLGSGSSIKGTAGSWQGGVLNGVTGGTNLIGTNGATFYITGVQLEQGSTATPYERRSYGQELSLCQRYYEKTELGVNATFACYTQNAGPGATAGFATVPFSFKQQKRTAPSIDSVVVNGAWVMPGYTAVSAGANHTFVAANITTDYFRFICTRVSGNTAPFNAGAYTFEVGVTYAASAEL